MKRLQWYCMERGRSLQGEGKVTLEDAKKRLLTKEGFRKAYEELQEEYDKIKASIRRKRMTDKLLPCPFCGGEAHYDKDWKDVQCIVCNARIFNHFKTKREAVEAWNNRFNSWHTGKPTEEGWYLIRISFPNCRDTYTTYYHNNAIDHIKGMVAWRKIEEN